jgi:hypothetical protein
MPRLALPIVASLAAALSLSAFAPQRAEAYQDRISAQCGARVSLPNGHIISPAKVSVVNTAYSPPEVDLFLDKGSDDGLRKGDLAYAIDCNGRMLPGLTMVLESASKSGARAVFRGDRRIVDNVRELVVDTSHGVEGLPATTFGGPAGSKPGTLTSAKIPQYRVLGNPPTATTDLVLLPGTQGYVVHPLEKKPLATFSVDEVSRKGSLLQLQLEPTANRQPEALSPILHYGKTCSFDVATPDFAKSSPAGHAFFKMKSYERETKRTAKIILSKSASDNVLPSSKVYLVRRKAAAPATLEIDSITATTVTVISSVTDRDTLSGNVLVQTATCK